MTNKKTNISLSNVKEDLKNDFTELTEKLGLTQTQLFEKMLQNFKSFDLKFTEEEQQVTEQAKKKVGDYYDKKIKTSILRIANNLLNAEEKEVNTEVGNSYHAANKRADEVLEKMIEINNNAENWTDRTFINQVSMSRFSSDLKDKQIVKYKLSTEVIRRCLANNKDRIAKHHESLELDKKHNLKKYHFLNKKTK